MWTSLVDTESTADVLVAVFSVATADRCEEAQRRTDALDAALRGCLTLALFFVYAYDLVYLLDRM